MFYVYSIKAKLMETCSKILSKYTFKKLSIMKRFYKTNVFFKVDVLYKIVKAIKLEQSSLAYLLVYQISILQKIFLIISKLNYVLRLSEKL